jgi:hypothetical protein
MNLRAAGGDHLTPRITARRDRGLLLDVGTTQGQEFSSVPWSTALGSSMMAPQARSLLTDYCERALLLADPRPGTPSTGWFHHRRTARFGDESRNRRGPGGDPVHRHRPH